MIITDSGMTMGHSTPAATARAMTPQAWATSSGPLHAERAWKGAHSSGVNRSDGETRGAAGMAAE